jgi:hypothetical protein
MRKQLFSLLYAVACLMVFADASGAQKSRTRVSAGEVNGTFRSYFSGKFKSQSNDLKIYALGGGKLHIAFDLVYPYVVNGELSANMGYLDGQAAIKGDIAIYESNEFGPCKITIKFIKPGTVKVTQDGTDAACGFGHNVMSDGIYRKVSGRKPKFDTNR